MEPDFNYRSDGPEAPLPQGPAPSNNTPSKPNTLATLSLITGIFALISCCFPPLQLLLGVAAIMLAIVSKKGAPFTGMAIAGLVLGGISVVSSLLIFTLYVYSLRIIQDPANAGAVKDFMTQYESLYESIQATQ